MKQFHLGMLAIVVCLFGGMAPIYAQSTSPAEPQQEQQIVQPSAAQLELNNQAVKAIGERKFAQAVRLFQASLDLGELNITYVNMGRAYQYMNECKKAEAAYERALSAPAIASPSPAEIAEVIARYQEELSATCTPDAPETDTAVTEPVSPSKEVTQNSEPGEPIKTIDPPPEVAPESSGGAGTYWLIGGGAAIAGGIALDLFPASATNGEFDALDIAPVGLYALGAGALVYGILLLVD